MIADKYKQFLINQKSRCSYRSYYQEYSRSYNQKNKEKILNYQKNKTNYESLMKSKGPLIEYKNEKTIITWD